MTHSAPDDRSIKLPVRRSRPLEVVETTPEELETELVQDEVQPAEVAGLPIINAFWARTDLTVVVADSSAPTGIRFRRTRAEHSCFVRLDSLEDPVSFRRMLNGHTDVRSALVEDDEWMRIEWRDREVLKHYCKAFHEKGILTYEGAVSPVLRHMVDRDLRPAQPRQIWVDLESDSRVPFSRKEEMRVLCWVAVDAEWNEYRGLLNEDTDEDEARLLRELWAVLEYYDQVMAWNGDRFDFPVIKARSDRVNLLRPSVREWRRWLWLDHLELFKRMNMSVSESGDEKQSYRLGVVAESVLGEGQGKIEFDASKTWEAWAEGGESRQLLLDYCAQDTRLMPQIEARTGYIRLLQTVADTCGTFPDTRGSQPGVQVEGFLARLARDRGHKFPTVLKTSEVVEGDQYEGAYVLHPQKKAGVHVDVHVADFAGLYPSIIRTWNMSPETIVEDADRGDLPCAYSPLTDKYFRTDVAGILPEAVKQLMQLRAEWNKKKASFAPGTEEWKDADRRAGAYKITTNSFYGVIGSPTSRFYDRRVAESVTQCGKWLIVATIRAAEERGMKVIYGDTDSLFVVGSTKDEFSDFTDWCNAELYPRILAEVGCIENVISLAYEKQFARLVLTTAKRYCGSYVHYKGKASTQDSKPEIKGLEFKRGDALRIAREIQEELAYLLVGYKQPASDNPDDYEAIVMRWRHRIMTERLELGDVLVSKRLNKELDQYKNNAPMTRVAVMLEERGQDVGEGAKIDYVVTNASVTPQEVIPAEDYDPDTTDLDRAALWDKLIWPPSQRLMEAAFPGYNWASLGGLVRERKAQAKAATPKKATKRKPKS